jgi:cytoskeletal protein CcmA (bactofilin family)
MARRLLPISVGEGIFFAAPKFHFFNIFHKKTSTMFGSSNKTASTNTAATAMKIDGGGDQTCIISKGTVIEGKFTCAENVRLDGTIIGTVHVEKRLVMGDTGVVDGNIFALNCAIKGKINGDITVKEQLHLLDTAKIEGNIAASSMIVDEGARHNGRSSIGTGK